MRTIARCHGGAQASVPTRRRVLSARTWGGRDTAQVASTGRHNTVAVISSLCKGMLSGRKVSLTCTPPSRRVSQIGQTLALLSSLMYDPCF